MHHETYTLTLLGRLTIKWVPEIVWETLTIWGWTTKRVKR